jgi:hypothetical protein
LKNQKRPAIDAIRRTPRGIPTASPMVRDVDESEEEGDVAGDVSEAAVAPADVADDEDIVDDEFEVVVSLGAFAVVVLVIVVATGRGGQRLPDASSTPRNSPGMKLNSCDEVQQEGLVPLLQQ